MSILVTTDISCDGDSDGGECFVCTEGVVSYKMDKRRARRQAKKDGWAWQRDENGYMVDLCPRCQQKEGK